jgi:hypothetical protein
MVKYEINLEGKFQCTICEYGHNALGKSRQSVSKHYNALHAEKSPNAPILPKEEKATIKGVDVIVDENDDNIPPLVPDWLTFEMGEEGEGEVVTVELSPTAASVLKGMAAGQELPTNPKALKDFYKQQGKMMKWIFAGGIDPMFAWYGRGVTSDPDFEIKRSASDWALFEDVSSNWLEYHGVTLPVTPDIIMAGTLASFYIPVLAKIQKKRDPRKPSFFKKLRSRRAMKKALKREAELNG